MITAAYSATRILKDYSGHAFSMPDEPQNDPDVIVNPDFFVVRDGYHVRFANGFEHLKKKMSLLVERMYTARGLHARHAASDPGRAGQTTLVACRGDHLFGTLTVGVDSGEGLLADTLYRPQIDAARHEGARVCELTRLAMDPSLNSPQVMATVFHLAFMVARFVHDMTDLFVEVHPRHAGFYRRMFGHRVAGPERTCPRVGAPAVLMRLPLDHAEQQILRHGGTGRCARRSLYPLFFSPAEQDALLQQLRTAREAA